MLAPFGDSGLCLGARAFKVDTQRQEESVIWHLTIVSRVAKLL